MRYWCTRCEYEISRDEYEMMEELCEDCFRKYGDKRKYLKKYFKILSGQRNNEIIENDGE